MCSNCSGLSNCYGGCYTGCDGCDSCASLGTCEGSCSNCAGQSSCLGGCSGGCNQTCNSCASLGTCQGGCTSCANQSNCIGGCNTGCLSTCQTCSATSSALAGCGADCTGQAYATRPTNFTGFLNVSSGVPFNITAADWNAFSNKIQAFALYKSKGLDIDAVPSVSTSEAFTDTTFNNAIMNLNVLSSFISISYPTVKNTGDQIAASYFISLKNALNSIN